MGHKTVIVSGATNQIGFFLLPRLIEADYQIQAISRRDPAVQKIRHDLITWHELDLSHGWKRLNIPQASSFIHLAPIWLIPDIIDDLFQTGVRRIISLSSTSIFSKINSRNIKEQEIVKKLLAAEESLIRKCSTYKISWTILRPTLIYGCGMDRNVTTIAKFIKRFGFFPLVGAGRGYRQPIHADDVAFSCLSVMNCEAAFNHTYNLSGGQILTFREMVISIFRSLGKKPVIINIPKELAIFLMECIKFIPAYRHVNRDMLERTDQDICFDSSDARRDFCYFPRGFKYEQT